MKASFVDLRRKSREILRALDRHESVVVYYRGRPKAVMSPVDDAAGREAADCMEHPSFGMWADRREMKDVASYVRTLRKGRDGAV